MKHITTENNNFVSHDEKTNTICTVYLNRLFRNDKEKSDKSVKKKKIKKPSAYKHSVIKTDCRLSY